MKKKKAIETKRYLFLTVLTIALGCATADLSDSGSPTVVGTAPVETAETAPAEVAATIPVEAAQAAPAEVAATFPVEVAQPAPVEVAEVPVEALTPSADPVSLSPEVATSETLAVAEAPVSNVAFQASDEIKTYRVRKNDTLMKIAFKIYGDPFGWDDIFQLNKELIQNPNFIHKGMTLRYKVPTNSKLRRKKGHPYTIKPGDTLTTISNALYGTAKKWKAIWEQNGDVIHNPQKIMAGLVLYYSGGHKPVVASSPPESSGDPGSNIAEAPAPEAEVRDAQSAGTVPQAIQIPSSLQLQPTAAQPQPTGDSPVGEVAGPSEAPPAGSFESVPPVQQVPAVAAEVEPAPAH